MANPTRRISVPLAILMSLGSPALAQVTPPANPASAPTPAARPERAPIEQVERRIAGLQRRLKITQEQQPQWDAFTAVMRQNATHMATLERDRADKVASLPAPDDMRSYADVARAHADDLARLVPAFDALYASMTPEQKATTDRTFHEFQRPGRARLP